MTMDRKTALKRLHLLLDCEMSDPEEANALRFAIEYLGDLQDEELERAYLSLSTALTAKNTTDLTEETVRAACNALHAYYRDRYESANVKPTRCAVCAGYHWPAMGPDNDHQGCDCAARSFTKFGRNFVCSHYGSEMDTMLFEFVHPMPEKWKDADPVCDNCIRKALREGILVEIPGDYPFGLVRWPKGEVSTEANTEEFEPPKALPAELAIAEIRRGFSERLAKTKESLAAARKYGLTPASSLALLHGDATTFRTALDALDHYERNIDFLHWCGEDEGLRSIGEAHEAMKAFTEGKTDAIERHHAHLAMSALSELAQARKRNGESDGNE